MQISINIDDKTAVEAEAIYEALGIDTETAVKMFLKRTVLEQRLPLDTSVPGGVFQGSAPTSTSVVEKSTKRINNVITRPMVEDIWRRFLRYLDGDGDINSAAADAHETTGMNQGSAFIYLTILDNFVNGKHNTRNMKMADLEYYVSQIRDNLDEQSYRNTIKSLELSIPYWDKEAFGQFAKKVRTFLDSLS